MHSLPPMDGRVMKWFPSEIDMDALGREIGSVIVTPIPDGSGHARGEGTKPGWLNGMANARLFGRNYDDRLDGYPTICRAVDEIHKVDMGRLTQVMVNRLAPYSALDKHRDGPPDHNRYHLPIVTHERVYWWDEINGYRHMRAGLWYGPVPYCGVLHGVENPTNTYRVHLVVDCAKR